MPRARGMRGGIAANCPRAAGGGRGRGGTLVQYPLARRRRHHSVTRGASPNTRGKPMRRRFAVMLVLGLMPWAELHAQAQQAQTTFKVAAKVQAVCDVTAVD